MDKFHWIGMGILYVFLTTLHQGVQHTIPVMDDSGWLYAWYIAASFVNGWTGGFGLGAILRERANEKNAVTSE